MPYFYSFTLSTKQDGPYAGFLYGCQVEQVNGSVRKELLQHRENLKIPLGKTDTHSSQEISTTSKSSVLFINNNLLWTDFSSPQSVWALISCLECDADTLPNQRGVCEDGWGKLIFPRVRVPMVVCTVSQHRQSYCI